MKTLPYPMTAADLETTEGPAWIVCRGGEERAIAAGLVACPYRGSVDVATCLACRYLALMESDRRLAWCDTHSDGPRGADDTPIRTIARAASGTPQDLLLELI